MHVDASELLQHKWFANSSSGNACANSDELHIYFLSASKEETLSLLAGAAALIRDNVSWCSRDLFNLCCCGCVWKDNFHRGDKDMEESKIKDVRPFEENSTPFVLQTVELKFSVPWGHIAAKAWGDHRGERILAVHGLEDNAATFNTLIPLLLRLIGHPLYIVSVDLPGHGRSSPLPPGIPYRFTDMLGCLRRVISQLEWHHCSYLGHSLGGLLGMYFAASYPDTVKKLVVLDAVSFFMYPIQYQSNLLRSYGERLLKLEKQDRAGTVLPSYSFDHALHRLADARGTEMTEAGTRALASRGLKPIPDHEDMHRFSRDQMIKNFIFPLFHKQEAIQIMSKVNCQLLLVTGSKSARIVKTSINGAVVEAVTKSCSYFKHHIVDGDHDVHLNFPERVAPLVAKFLSEPVSCL